MPRLRPILLVLIGIGLLYSSVYVGDVRGDRYYLSTSQTEPPIEGDVQSYDDLPPEAQTVFDEARTGGTVELYEHSDQQTIEALWAVDYVRINGTYYRLSVSSEVNDSTFGEFLNQYLISPLLLIGGFLVALGILTAHSPDWQPDTPHRVSAVIVLAWLCSVIGAIVSLFVVTGQWLPGQYIQTFTTYAGAFTIGLVPLLTGSAIRRRNWPLVGVTALPIVILGVLGIFDTVFLFGFIVVLLIGLPVMGCGYWLTDSTA